MPVRRRQQVLGALPTTLQNGKPPVQTGDTNGVIDDTTGTTEGTAGSTGTATPTHTPVFSEEPKDDPKDWPKKNARWLAMAIILVVGFSVLAVFFVWLKRRLHRKRAEEAARLQTQALEAAVAASGSRGNPDMSTGPGAAPPLGGLSQQSSPSNHPLLQASSSEMLAAKDGSDSESNSNPATGFSHAPGTRITAYEDEMAQQAPLAGHRRQESHSGSARSRISALFAKSPRQPNDVITGQASSPGWATPVHQSPHTLSHDQLTYPIPTRSERS
ncbi:hypothetical protein KEM52_004835 [Ascosphaera acerosa]|nr:hypothetical protein KEM52_004835 [Ascosphaera acerosa]